MAMRISISRRYLAIACILIANCRDAIGQPLPSSVITSEICNNYNARRIYLELGEHGVLHGLDATVPRNQKSNAFPRNRRLENDTNIDTRYQCQLELITCPSCIVQLSIISSNFTKLCSPNDYGCNCTDYLSFTEPPYDDDSMETRWCGQSNEFVSRTRVVVITYVYQTNRSNVFSLTYETKKNQIITHGLSSNVTIRNDSFESPFFPNFYPRDLSIEHIFVCDDGLNETDCILEIEFSDFQISTSSAIEIIDHNDQLLGIYTGSVFRPPIIYSTGPALLVRFLAKGDTGLGYRGRVRYLTRDNRNKTIDRSTHCGGLVESFGGAITMMNMIDDNSTEQYFDCIWLMNPPSNYMHSKTHLMLRVDAFDQMANESSVIIREGITSNGPLMEQYEWPHDGSTQFATLVTTLESGFYVSFRGVFNASTRFVVVYTAFSYMDCVTGPEFLCENHRCIPFYLQCDGFDHCGDGSDESSNCLPETDADVHRHWYKHTPNYFFPKMEQYPDLKAAAIVFFASTMGLLLLIFFLIVVLYRMGAHMRDQRELQSQLRTISEILDNNNAQALRDEEDGPPAYEAYAPIEPPDYEEAAEQRRSRRSSEVSSRKRKRSRSRSRNSHGTNEQSVWLFSSTPTPSDILIPELFLSENRLQADDIIECAVSSRNIRRHSECALVHSRRNSQIPLIPESPPPEYSQQPIAWLSTLPSTSAALVAEIQQTPTTSPAEGGQTLTIPNSLNLRRHSSQDDCPCEIFQRQITNHLQGESGKMYQNHRMFSRSALNWLGNFNLMRVNGRPKELTTASAYMQRQQRCSSESNLLMSPEHRAYDLGDAWAIRKSYSSGILF